MSMQFNLKTCGVGLAFVGTSLALLVLTPRFLQSEIAKDNAAHYEFRASQRSDYILDDPKNRRIHEYWRDAYLADAKIYRSQIHPLRFQLAFVGLLEVCLVGILFRPPPWVLIVLASVSIFGFICLYSLIHSGDGVPFGASILYIPGSLFVLVVVDTLLILLLNVFRKPKLSRRG